MAALAVEQTLTSSALGVTSGLTDLLMAEIGGRRVLYVLSRSEQQLLEIEIATDGSLSFVASLPLVGGFASGSYPELELISAGGASGLAIGGVPEADGQVASLSGNGGLGAQQSLAGLGTLVAPAYLNLSATDALVSGRQGQGGIDLFTGSSGLSWSASLDDAADRYLADVAASVVFATGGSDYVATLSASEDGLNIASVSVGALGQIGALGAEDEFPINIPRDIAVVQRLDETLLLVAASGSSSLSVVRFEGGGPILADHILDAEWTQLLGAEDVAGISHGDFAFAVAGGAEGGVSIFTVLPGGRLVHLDSLADDDITALYRVSDIELTIIGDELHIYASSHWEAGLTRLSYDLSGLGVVAIAADTGAGAAGTAANDQIIGSVFGEVLSGGAGDDILLDGAGMDTLTGGAGADLFAMSADGLTDTITDFERGVDKLDLSAFDFLYDVSQLEIAPTGNGATISHGNEAIVLYTSDGAPLTAGELTTADILNVDRPPLLAVGQELFGGAGADTLNGGAGNDTIHGADGDDEVYGNFGADTLTGGSGLDLIRGGGGNDTILGHSGHDTLVGDLGDDLIIGDVGDDVIYGDEMV